MMKKNDFKRATELINKSKNILIAAHTRPDGDACGSVVALNHLFHSLRKKSQILLLTQPPQWYSFLFDKPPAYFDKKFTQKKLNQFDLVVLADVNSKTQLPGFADLLKQNSVPILVIDHHITSDGLGDVSLLDTSAAAAGLIVFDLIKFAGWPLNQKTAQALFLAVASDTGWFHFKNTDSRVHRACADLIDAKVNPAQIYRRLYQSFSLPRFKLMTIMLDTLQLHFNGRFATQYLLRKGFKRTGAADSDTENLIDECQRIRTVQVAALFIELKDRRIRCSLRSSSAVDVRKIAQKFGGGGHKQAAGTFLPGPLNSAINLIKSQVRKQIS
jgi:phosphoesterase RecJ-like protein